MYLGWSDFLKAKFAKASSHHSIGIEFGLSSLQIAVFKIIQGEVCWTQQHSLSIDNWANELQLWVKEAKLQYTPLHAALSFERYQLLQVEKPSVPDAEINQALSWTAEDLTSIPAPLTVDYFDLPVQAMGQQQINVVAMSSDFLNEVIEGAVRAQLLLKSVSPAELLRCDFIGQRDEAVVNLTQEQGGDVSLNIIKQGQLHFNRRLKGYTQLQGLSESDFDNGVLDNLSLDIQRSTDYFESQLRQPPIKKVLVTLDNPHIYALSQRLSQSLSIPVEVMEPSVNTDMDRPYSIDCITSIAAGLFGPRLVEEAL